MCGLGYSNICFYSKATHLQDVFKLVLGELKEVWKKAGVPIRSDNSCLSFLTKLFKKKAKYEENRAIESKCCNWKREN